MTTIIGEIPTFDPWATDRAEYLRDTALVPRDPDDPSCGLQLSNADDHPEDLAQRYYLPDWFIGATAAVEFNAPEAPVVENWACTYSSFDWPTLIEAHPDVLAVLISGADNPTASRQWDAIVEAFRLLRSQDPDAYLYVYLWVSPLDGDQIAINPVELWTSRQIDTDLEHQVDTILTTAQFPDLHYFNEYDVQGRRGWRFDY